MMLANYRAIANELAEKVEAIAGEENVSVTAAFAVVIAETKRALGDGRHVRWRARVRIYSAADNFTEAVADSDPDAAPDAAGAEICRGLGNVADYLAQLATAFHHGPCNGLGTQELEHRLKALRPTLSRRGGDAAWRVPYQTMEHIGNVQTTREWLARVDIERINPGDKP